MNHRVDAAFLRFNVEKIGLMTCLANQSVSLTEIGRIALTAVFATTVDVLAHSSRNPNRRAHEELI